MYYNNTNGYQSKEHSFLNIIKDVTPDVIALCETKSTAKTIENLQIQIVFAGCAKQLMKPKAISLTAQKLAWAQSWDFPNC